jgi:hypothetical protein
MAVVDWTDPCARVTALRAAYFELVQGGEASVRVRNGEHEQEVRYSQTSVAALQRELRIAEAECAAKNGTTPPRYAIRGGAMRGGC